MNMQIKTTMKAAVVKAFGEPLVIEQVPVPQVGPGQILVKIAATGVCHTDLHAAEGDWPIKPNPPFIPGHEGVGQVVALGEGVKHLKMGDRVGVPWLYSACGHCEHCLDSWETLCLSQQNAGYSVNGSFAEYCLADANYVGIIPDNVDYNEIAPILCAGVTVYKGLKMTDTKPGDWVVISGIGGLGHMAVQYAVAMGLNVAAVDIDDEKLAFAKRLGASVVANAKNVDPAKVFQESFWRCAWRAGHGGFTKSVRTGDWYAASWRHHGAERIAAGQIRSVDFRYGVGRHYGARFHRRDAQRSAGSAGFRRSSQGESHRSGRTAD